MPFDPGFPPQNAPLLSQPWRDQFNGLQTNIQARALEDECVGRLLTTARSPAGVALLDLAPSDPPTAADVQALVAKINELIQALQR